MTANKDEFTCYKCKKTFKKAWAEDEAIEEMESLWEGVDMEDMVVTCDDCFKSFIEWYNRGGHVTKN